MNWRTKIFKEELKKVGWFHPQTTTHALGGGEWSIEVYGPHGFLCEYVGENGTHGPADDLWGEFTADWDDATLGLFKSGVKYREKIRSRRR